MGYYLFNRPRRDGKLSWPCWLTDRGRFTHKVVTQPSTSLAQDMESSPARTDVLTTVLHHLCGHLLAVAASEPDVDQATVTCRLPLVSDLTGPAKSRNPLPPRIWFLEVHHRRLFVFLQPIYDASGIFWNGLRRWPVPLTGNERERKCHYAKTLKTTKNIESKI